ncbi:hypothetical protein PAXRUDRAFT_401862 [Paxillus rubicundulus Ve08.2h10]|uniref:Uncharacterized protein n=1 Tax=Paxillus rubicundulus Ve08.2h10 TaxID=930991 RepID=A0A0D0E8R3_9AGAM|nr:hypothetical protein PAXRUDRAFT_401862 [Paxillus rubicundulus Ve08.2h10]
MALAPSNVPDILLGGGTKPSGFPSASPQVGISLSPALWRNVAAQNSKNLVSSWLPTATPTTRHEYSTHHSPPVGMGRLHPGRFMALP